MKVAVWGAGDVGTALAYRLVTSPRVSEPCDECGKPRPRSTRHPIIEAAMAVVETIDADAHRVMTVSAYDPERGVCWSVPCTLGRAGVVKRHVDWIDRPAWEGLREPLAKLHKLVMLA